MALMPPTHTEHLSNGPDAFDPSHYNQLIAISISYLRDLLIPMGTFSCESYLTLVCPKISSAHAVGMGFGENV